MVFLSLTARKWFDINKYRNPATGKGGQSMQKWHIVIVKDKGKFAVEFTEVDPKIYCERSELELISSFVVPSSATGSTNAIFKLMETVGLESLFVEDLFAWFREVGNIILEAGIKLPPQDE